MARRAERLRVTELGYYSSESRPTREVRRADHRGKPSRCLEYFKGRYPKWRTPKLVEYSPETDTSTGERRAWKLASGVRRGARGKGRCESYLACGLPYWLLGFSGPKEEAEEIKQSIRDFLRETLKLDLSVEKTLITHARTGAAKFLGYHIVSQHADDKLDRRGQRQVNEMIGLRVPKEVIEQKCALYMRRGKPAQRAEMLGDSDYSILNKYQAEYRGVVNYYLLAHNVRRFSKLRWISETSLLKTLAGKHKSEVTAMARKYKTTIETASGPRKCLQVVIPREDKKPLIARFGGIPLQRKQEAILVDHQPQFFMTNRSELLQRVYADQCELCGSQERVEVHHIRKLAELEKVGHKERPIWMKQMLIRRRKTLVVCRQCHEAIHAGRPTAPFRRKGTGEPRDAKVSRVVREEDNGKGP